MANCPLALNFDLKTPLLAASRRRPSLMHSFNSAVIESDQKVQVISSVAAERSLQQAGHFGTAASRNLLHLH
jgi:hypothetical protein